MQYQTGSLVHVRNRDWVVMPSPSDELLVLKPLGGTEEQITGIYLPLGFESGAIRSTKFELPTGDDIGSLFSAKLLYNALRLSIRNASGPFRSIAKLSFRPRAYQIVPLIMALRFADDPIRLLIADDVGIGKTIEALLIVKELLERKEIERFAVICPPHLCEQWQEELRDKFGIDAVIIRPNTQAKLDRQIQGDVSVFKYYKYQVISIDYIKNDKRRPVFVNECPELVVVDEAHTCALPVGATRNQQQRHALIREIAEKAGQNLLLLTATPHSGKAQQFGSLLDLLEAGLGDIDLPEADRRQREQVARYFVQRRRGDVIQWHKKSGIEQTPFPRRETEELGYDVSPHYKNFFEKARNYAIRLIDRNEQHRGKMRIQYWSALSLLRGIMSSPVAGELMLTTKLDGEESGDGDESPEYSYSDLADEETSVVFDSELQFGDDRVPTDLMSANTLTKHYRSKLVELKNEMAQLKGMEHDNKVKSLIRIVSGWMQEGFNTVVFCRFIGTANYVGEIVKSEIGERHKGIDIRVATGEDPDELRKQKIVEMGKSEKRILIATDCLSEGINLQEYFTAVVHYDLPWNPNRLEQREGRVDRFGQTAPLVKAALLYAKNNPVDGAVLNVLLRKVREIRKSIGISIPFPEDSTPVLEAIAQGVLFRDETADDTKERLQQELDLDFYDQATLEASKALEEAAKREERSHSIFAQHAIHPEEIEEDLEETDNAIGDPLAVETFVKETCERVYSAQLTEGEISGDYGLLTTNLPGPLKRYFETNKHDRASISFRSPTPREYQYVGRNHPFVEQLSSIVESIAFEGRKTGDIARAAVVQIADVRIKTVVLLFRVRNVIEEIRRNSQLVAEEMILSGYRGSASDRDFLAQEEASDIIENAAVTGDISVEARKSFLTAELTAIENLQTDFNRIAEERAELLVDQHERYRKAFSRGQVKSQKYRIVRPVLPMDLIGLYILLPGEGGKA